MTAATKRKPPEDAPTPLLGPAGDDSTTEVAEDDEGAEVPRSPEDQAARRVFDLYGESLIESCRTALANADRDLSASDSDPTAFPPGRLPRWLSDWETHRRPRHRLAQLLTYFENRAAGRDGPFALDEPALADAVAADLVQLLAWSGAESVPDRLRYAAKKTIAACEAELDAVRGRLTHEALVDLFQGQTLHGGWSQLRDLFATEADLGAKLARWRTALERLPAAMASHISAALDDAGGDDALAVAMDQASGAPLPPPIEADKVVMRLTAELDEARSRVASWEAAGRVGFGAILTDPIEQQLNARREKLLAERNARIADSLGQSVEMLKAARAGDCSAFWQLVAAIQEHPQQFPSGLAGRLKWRAGLALVEAGASAFRDAIDALVIKVPTN